MPGSEAATREAAGWDTAVYRDDAALEDGSPLAAEWDALWRRSPGASAFQHRAWLSSWWSAYGGGRRLCLVVVRHGNRAVAAAALYARTLLPSSVLHFVGAGVSDYGDVLVDTAEPEAAARLAAALESLRRPLDLREMPPGAAAFAIAEQWSRRVRRFPDSSCPWLPAMKFDDMLSRLPRRTATRARAKAKQIERLGVCARRTEPGDAAAAVDTLLRLHEEYWRGRAVNPEHLSPRFAVHLRTAVPALVADGVAEVVRFDAGGETVGADLLLCSRGECGAYLFGVSPELRRRVDIMTMVIGCGLGQALEHGADRLSMLRGTEAAKLRWCPELAVNTRVVLDGGLIGPWATGGLAARIRARSVIVRIVPGVRGLRRATRRVLRGRRVAAR